MTHLKKQKNKNNKIRWERIIDCIYLVLFPILATLFILLLRKYTNKYTLLAIIAFILIYIICILSLFLKNKMIEIVRRVLMVILCATLIFATVFVKNISDGFNKLIDDSKSEMSKTVKMDLLVLKNHEPIISDIDTLKDLVIGVQTSNDKDASAYVEDQLQKKIGNTYHRLEYGDYTTMYNDFYNGYVDAIVVNQEQKQYLSDTYANLYQDTTNLKTYSYTYTDSIDRNDIDITSKVFTVYISATDQINAPASYSLSDMNMIMIIDPISNHITTIPIPRDSFIPNPAMDNQNDKLTHSGSYGINNTIAAVEQAFQIDIDFYVKVSFTSLIEIVDTLGGIDVNVLSPITEQDENRSFASEDLIHLDAGYQHLDGRQTLAYTRHRDSYVNQDLGRNQAQLEVMKGLISRLTSADGINKIDDILKILPEYVIMNFSESQITAFIKQQVDNMKPWSVTSLAITNGLPDTQMTASDPINPLSVYLLSQKDIQKVNALYHILKKKNTFAEFGFTIDDLYSKDSTFTPDENMMITP